MGASNFGNWLVHGSRDPYLIGAGLDPGLLQLNNRDDDDDDDDDNNNFDEYLIQSSLILLNLAFTIGGITIVRRLPYSHNPRTRFHF